MNAKALVEKYGKSLIGRLIDTPAIGSYPGGQAVVIEIAPDPAAPEIVCQVKLPGFGEMGIYEHEEVKLIRRRDKCNQP